MKLSFILLIVILFGCKENKVQKPIKLIVMSGEDTMIQGYSDTVILKGRGYSVWGHSNYDTAGNYESDRTIITAKTDTVFMHDTIPIQFTLEISVFNNSKNRDTIRIHPADESKFQRLVHRLSEGNFTIQSKTIK